MFTCSRLVDRATTDDNLPPPGMCLAEAVQLARDDPANVQRLIKYACKKLTVPRVNVRIKALRLMSHLAQNGPSSAVQAEIKLYSSTISDCIGWRGRPDPLRGYEPYQEMKDVAQSLLDLIFTSGQATVQHFATTTPTAAPTQRVASVSTMESYGNDQYITQPVSLDPVNHDPTANRTLENITGFFSRTFGGQKAPVVSKYGSASNVSGNVPGTTQGMYVHPMYQTAHTQPPTYQSPNTNTYQPPQPAQPAQPQIPSYTPPPPPPQRGQFQRLEADFSWSKKKPSNPIPERSKNVADTPASKFLKVTGGRALPTNGEITAFKASIVPESLVELTEALNSSEWKVKVRAIYGLEVFGEKFGIGTVAHVKKEVEKLKVAPQASLRSAAIRFYASIENVEPTDMPEQPSAFTFTDEAQSEPPQEDEEQQNAFSFVTEENVNEKEVKKEEPKQEEVEAHEEEAKEEVQHVANEEEEQKEEKEVNEEQ
ncbi:AP-4 complex accessory subunit tepsin-like [Histomonas meleagridis]|uniref:AP-4 complex accessory subunit tepsin-like n=1 Tax=Histomonas meleagridis TaxID=135588 RepID=UPI00355A4D94|nr:AP-4 complex accessory subunit tepsin-like [Histomonas meleagridis]KAH0806169.1 AP-4 complex accessory subunit tepsin-like [Histomonas meleagridis]